MKATETKLLKFISKSPQFVIPIYQRAYSWTEKQCKQLWDDIIRSGSDNRISAHFLGSIVYIEEGLSTVTVQSPLLVIDGQQRITSVTLLLKALAETISDQEPVDGFSKKKLTNYYLINDLEEGERRYKILLSQTDKKSLLSIIDGKEPPKDKSIKIFKNYEYFKSLIDENKDNLEIICKGISKLLMVDISLNRDDDNPQLIFESMNSTGLELTQADLIRNYILMGLEPGFQADLYERYWRPMELDFGQAAYDKYFDGFMRNYLTLKTGSIPNLNKVYEAFKKYALTPDIHGAGTEALVADIRKYSRYYRAIALGGEPDSDLNRAFHDLRELKVDTAYPLLLELYADYDAGILQKHELLETVRLVESYVFRRAVSGIPTNSMNKTFATFTKKIKKDRYFESIKATFLLLPTYRRFPRDEEFRRAIEQKDFYNFDRRSFWLRRLENFGRKERVSVDEYTIEHIMPQNENLSPAWKNALGDNWQRIHEEYLHSAGNLTLTGYNSEYSDKYFTEKRDMQGGFRESPLRLNEGLAFLDYWNESTIKQRSKMLSNKAVNVWKSPKLEDSILDAYRPKPERSAYSIDDHHHLQSGITRELFTSFRKAVLELDPCVSEEFLKLYVAYKAETNFVDVVPQAKRLRLSLNIDFDAINDHRGLCKDVSSLGRWGNGDVEVGLESLVDLPYIMGLVRQAFEKQMGDEGTFDVNLTQADEPSDSELEEFLDEV